MGTSCQNLRLGQPLIALGLAVVLAASAIFTTGPAYADDAPPRTITAVLTGDIMAHSAVNKRALLNGNGLSYDYRPMFSDIEPLIAGADLAVCHLEGPIAPAGSGFTGAPYFGTPKEIVSSIKDVGFDTCSLANNHSNDRGRAGIAATIEAFDEVGLPHSGTGRTPAETLAPILDVKGVKVVQLAYTFKLNCNDRLSATAPMQVNRINPKQIIADAVDARERGAEIVIVSLHWGQEFHSTVSKSQSLVANELTASGQIDLIAGSHVHVLQPIRQVNGTWVLFGLGNLLSNQRKATVGKAETQDGAVVRVTFTEKPGGGFTVAQPVVVPTWVDERTFSVLEIAQHYDSPSQPEKVRRGLFDSWRRTARLLTKFVEPPPGPDPDSLVLSAADCPSTRRGAVVYRPIQRGMLCDRGAIIHTFPVTTGRVVPLPGEFTISSRNTVVRSTEGGHVSILKNFVAFTKGSPRIAFHSVPTLRDGSLVQPLSSVGERERWGTSAGCIRVLPDDSKRIWQFLRNGDKVRLIG